MSSDELNLDETASKDVVLFSQRSNRPIKHKNELDFLQPAGYPRIEIPDYENDPKYRVWGLPFYDLMNTPVISLICGVSIGNFYNRLGKRPRFSNIHVHIGAGILCGLGFYIARSWLENYRYNNEKIVWDYVRKHPEDFPEVFTRPKKYADVLYDWRTSR